MRERLLSDVGAYRTKLFWSSGTRGNNGIGIIIRPKLAMPNTKSWTVLVGSYYAPLILAFSLLSSSSFCFFFST